MGSFLESTDIYVKFTILTKYTEESSTVRPINNLIMSISSTTLWLHEHPTSIKTTIEFFDELLTRGDCLLEV